MSIDFEKVWIEDPRLMSKSNVKFGVFTGASSCVPTAFPCQSPNVNSLNFNISVPSENTVVDRKVNWENSFVLKISGQNPSPSPINLFNYGVSDALAPFPMHQLISTMQYTANSNSMTSVVQDVLNPILNMTDKQLLAEYSDYCPTALDTRASYSDSTRTIQNPLGGVANKTDIYTPRGSWKIDWISSTTAGTDGVYDSVEIPAEVGGVAGSLTVYVKFTTTEPIGLTLSPFILGGVKQNAQGAHGYHNINFVVNLKNLCNRLWRRDIAYVDTGKGNNIFVGTTFNVSLQAVVASTMYFTFLTPKMNDSQLARNVLGYWELTSNVTPVKQGLIPKAVNKKTSDNMTLNQIPDKAIIYARKSLNSQTYYDPDFYLKVRALRLDFNNVVGYFTSTPMQELYNISKVNHSNMSWLDFSGTASEWDSANSTFKNVGMLGSMIVVSFGRDVTLSSEYLAPSVLGNFNLKYELEVENQTEQTLLDYEMVCLVLNSGIYVLERGTTSVYSGVLDAEMVLSAIKDKSAERYDRNDLDMAMVGGFSVRELSKNFGKKFLRGLPAHALDALQGSLSGSGMAGEGMAGEGKRKSKRKL